MTISDNYLLKGGAAELERLRLQARVWEPDTELMLNQIGIKDGWKCIDLGCGAMGILGPLSKRVGANGLVVGVDNDSKQLQAAREYTEENKLKNIKIIDGDIYDSHLEKETFDFTHIRFVFAPAGRDEELLNQVINLTKPGGFIAVQEPDAASWNCYPIHPSWIKLKNSVLSAFKLGGGDFDAGRRTFKMLKSAGLEDIKIRAAVLALQNNHPYRRLPVQFAISLRKRIVENNLLTDIELDKCIQDVEAIAADPETIVISFIVTQVWGRKPESKK